MEKERTGLQKATINNENSSLCYRDKSFEEAVKILPESTLEEYLKETAENRFLEKVPLEMRKEETVKPIYLIRYE